MSFGASAPGPQSKLGPHSPEEIPAVVIRMIEELDSSVGRVLAALKAQGLDENTLVIFTSDNGGYRSYARDYSHGISNNGPLRGQKGDVHEGGHRVPAIARWPGRIPAGVVSDVTAMSMDLPPTFLELAELPAPAADGPGAFDGVSLAGLLTRQTPPPERPLFWRHAGPKGARAARLGPWKLVQPPGKKPPELYHLGNDLAESQNLAAGEPGRVEMLLDLLSRWEAGLP